MVGEAGAGDGFGADGGRPKFGPTARRPGRGPGAGAAVGHGRKRDVVLRLLRGEALHALLILPEKSGLVDCAASWACLL
jgi:hypothetical protein